MSLANPAGGRPIFRKKILPLSTIRHPDTGERVTFDRAYHQSLIDSFAAGAVEQTPLQLADDRNRHNMNPELTRAHVVSLSHATPADKDGPGLYADFVPHSGKAAKLLRRNPGLGVSCSILENRERVDGQRFPRVLRHVLATLDPRVVGLGQWRAVSLSQDEDGQVLNLTEAKYREISVAKGDAGKSGALELSEAEAEAAVLAAVAELGDDEIEPAEKEPKGAEVDQARKSKKDKGRAAGKKGKGTQLSNPDDGRVLNLAVELDEARAETAGIRGELAASKWATERGKLSLAGVPKVFLDLAERVLSSPDPAVLSLSNSDGVDDDVDAADVIRKMLQAARGIIDLSNPDGVAVDPSDANGGNTTETALVDSAIQEWSDRFGAPAVG